MQLGRITKMRNNAKKQQHTSYIINEMNGMIKVDGQGVKGLLKDDRERAAKQNPFFVCLHCQRWEVLVCSRTTDSGQLLKVLSQTEVKERRSYN